MMFCFFACGDTPVSSYTVNYVDGVNDAEITVPSDTNQYHVGDTVTVKFTEIGNRANYTFSGWSDGTTTYTSDGTTSFTMGNANVTLTAQWTSVYLGTKTPMEAKEVGDIVFNDGSATPYTADLELTFHQQCNAMAFIFYKGTELNNGDDTTTVRTLGVSFCHADGGWTSPNGENVNITTIQCAPKYEEGRFVGFVGDRNGSDNLEQIAAFCGCDMDSGIFGELTRVKNGNWLCFWHSNIIIRDSEFKNGWYIPSIAEFYQLSKVIDMYNAVSALCFGDRLGYNPESRDYYAHSYISYTSSSQVPERNNCKYVMTILGEGRPGVITSNSKLVDNRYCPIREFN